MINCAIIIPVHTFDENIKEMLKTAINSVPDAFTIKISTTKDIVSNTDYISLKESFKDKRNIETIYSQSDKNVYDFMTLVNQAVDETYEWFSILELDDTYTDIWFNNVERYLDYNQNYDIILPLTDIFDFNTKKYIGIGNEAPWASSFSNEIGYFDLDSIKDYFSFFPTGGVYKTSTWKELGGLKSIHISFWYELFLRYLYNNKTIFVIPKIGYNHNLNREGSLMKLYEANMTDDDSKEAFKKAKKDYKTIIKPNYENVVKE